MGYVYVFLAVMAAVIIHEGAHALAMRKRGIAIRRFGIGLPVTPGIRIKLQNFVPLYIHPVLLGAYVEPVSEDDIKSLSVSAQNEISSAGVFWNIITGGVVMLLYSLVVFGQVSTITMGVSLFVLAILLFKRWIANFVPLLGIVLVVYLLFFMPGVSGSDGGATLLGPIGIVNIFGSSSIPFVVMFASLSLAIGIFNMLPIPPLDGGRVFIVFLEKIKAPRKIINVANLLGIILIVAVLVFATLGDIGRLL